jgi:hypothetical protein
MFSIMDRNYYILWYRLDGRDAYLIWYSNEQDGVLVDEDGRALKFRDSGSLLKYAESRDIHIEAGEQTLHNLDELGEWLNSGEADQIRCDTFNGAWNLFADVSFSIGGDFDADKGLTQEVYNKLLWGCDLPSVTPEGEQYHPAWTKRELKIMRDVLSAGLQMFRSSVRCD